jgi:hypothetical protein
LIWNCTWTLNIELSMEKTLDSNCGITVCKKLLDGKHTMLYVPMRHGYKLARSVEEAEEG